MCSQARLSARVLKCPHALLLQFLVILWYIYTNIKILFIDSCVMCAFEAQEWMASQLSVRGTGAQEWRLGKVS